MAIIVTAILMIRIIGVCVVVATVQLVSRLSALHGQFNIRFVIVSISSMLIMLIVLLIIVRLAMFVLIICILALMDVAVIVMALRMARHCGRLLERLKEVSNDQV